MTRAQAFGVTISAALFMIFLGFVSNAEAYDYRIDLHTPGYGTLQTPDGDMHSIEINDYSADDEDIVGEFLNDYFGEY